MHVIITHIKDFGAFARLTDPEVPIEGLIHISEMNHEYVNVENIEDFVTVGEEREVRIIRLDRERRRLGPSLKQV